MDLNKEISPDHPQRSFWIVFVAATIMLSLKLFMSYRVYGTNDIESWLSFAKYIKEYGTFNIYPHMWFYNHPPFMSWFLKFMPIQNEAGFPFLFRLFPILADYGSIFVIWKLLTLYKTQHKLLICLICSLNPINFFISGYHGNTDSIFIFLILLTIYLLEKKNTVAGGIVYALSICIKIVPLAMAPFIFYYLRSKKDRVVLFLILLTMSFVVFLPYLIFDYQLLIRNIFKYGGLPALWGVGHMLKSAILNNNYSFQFREILISILLFHIQHFAALFALSILFLARYFMNHRTMNLVEACFFVYGLFFVFTPGFGVQYLSWLSLFAVIVNPLLGASYVLLGGVFIYRVYAYWGGAVPPYYANSKVGPWTGFDGILDLILWFLVVIMLIKFLYDKKILPINLKALNYRLWMSDLRAVFCRTIQKN